MRHRIMFLSTMFVTASIGLDADAQTIREIARTRPTNPIVRGRMSDIEPATLQQLARGADLVLDATVVRLQSYLTPDEDNVLTDYQVVPTRVLLGRVTTARTTPGTVSPLIVTTYGGDITIDGFTVSVVDHALKRLESGRRYLLFLDRFGAEGHYQLHKAGAFQVDDQDLKSIVTRDKHVFEDITQTPFNQAVQLIGAIAAERNK